MNSTGQIWGAPPQSQIRGEQPQGTGAVWGEQPQSSAPSITLSEEQLFFIEKAKEGHNILVDACIGSGKTTAIQHLCDALPSEQNILYLTYNKLLKIDARDKIRSHNITVNNYHGFAWSELNQCGLVKGVSSLVTDYNRHKPKPYKYDVLILDEYQDITLEISKMLQHIKSANPSMQIVCVGDMEQKIYDTTTLNVPTFVNSFLGEHLKLEFTQCFRLSKEFAATLGRIWKKTIVGRNTNCQIKEMNMAETIEFLSAQEPKDILCLGKKEGYMVDTLNKLEQKYPQTFNKHTVYASIREKDGNVRPNNTSAIFTTYDSSKGLERRVCVVFDFDEAYWRVRRSMAMQSYEILRNIFCVAASRGKETIIFVNTAMDRLSEDTLSTDDTEEGKFKDVAISGMFDFKYQEDVEQCYSLLDIKQITAPGNQDIISIDNTDALIDLSPCIGIYQESVFFKNYDILESIDDWLENNPTKKYLYKGFKRTWSLDQKILFLTSLETLQNRYRNQVKIPFVSDDEKYQIITRLHQVFKTDEVCQTVCEIPFSDPATGKPLFVANGRTDVIKDDIIYELKFVSELSYEHFLQCACYLIALRKKKGVLWNVRTNEMHEIQIPNRQAFLDAVAKAITKGYLTSYYDYHETPKKQPKIALPTRHKQK